MAGDVVTGKAVKGQASNNGRGTAQGGSGQGPGRILVTIYAILALAATVRGISSLARHGSEAPLAYTLSVAAGVIYLIAAVALTLDGRWRPVAWLSIGIELVGVLAIGTWSLFDGTKFPDETVWSAYGRGYGWVPLILPIVGLWWLWRSGRDKSGTIEAGPRD